MGIRDEEIDRLIKYAEGLDLKVVRRKYRRGDPGATYDHNTKTIELYFWPGQSKTRTILNMLHELGHHFDWVHNLDRKPDTLLLEDALDREWKRTSRADPVIPKSKRKIIYEMECRGIDYMSTIAKEVGVKIPLWKIKAEQAYDKWTYYYYYMNGDHPTTSVSRRKINELNKRFNNV